MFPFSTTDTQVLFSGEDKSGTSPLSLPTRPRSLPHSQPFRLQGFHPLDGFLLAIPRWFVSPSRRSWDFPFRAFPFPAAETPFGDSYPLGVAAVRYRNVPLDFRVFIRVEVRWLQSCVSAGLGAPMLSWVFSPFGFFRITWVPLTRPRLHLAATSGRENSTDGRRPVKPSRQFLRIRHESQIRQSFA